MMTTRNGQRTSMRHLILSLLLLASFSLAASPAVAAAPDGLPSVAIQKRRIVLVRKGEIVRRFPDRKRVIINYPMIRGPRNSPVLRKVRALFDFKNIFEVSLAEYREDAWLTDFGYKVNYNQNYILDIAFTQEGAGAYPDSQTKYFVINLRNGELIRAADAFNSSSLDELASLVDKKLQAEIEETISRLNAEEKDAVESMLRALKFDASKLNDFSVSDKGITFLYDAGFPHVVQALQPDGSYFFSYAELKSYIKRDGPLGIFIR